jgi:hypothetical protein
MVGPAVLKPSWNVACLTEKHINELQRSIKPEASSLTFEASHMTALLSKSSTVGKKLKLYGILVHHLQRLDHFRHERPVGYFRLHAHAGNGGNPGHVIEVALACRISKTFKSVWRLHCYK